MKGILTSFFWICLLLSSCEYYNYGKGVQADTKKEFELEKGFFKSLHFIGNISKKLYCERCDLNKYQFIISLKIFEPQNINIGFLSFQPFYSFNNENQLVISVNQSVFENLKVGSFVIKEKDSDFLNCGSRHYKILEENGFQWIPK